MSLITFFEKLISAEIGVPPEKLTPEVINRSIEKTSYRAVSSFVSSYGGHTATASESEESYTEEDLERIRKKNDEFLSSFLK